ncbi:outer membrane lipoprotein chaperone LolA [Sulfurimonas lithotrophica]|uniref:Outer membrane lipoprotein chaperone LolA n=1 Tax=Sulfurimonas lithotrophica TaxID=2590022 RepID=A0A5P8P0T9_9BACT|nr:LolA-like outer membrane lipoprotein chaperone [Sulfurimonas lithotrophica]QFR49309.1 outer membrane lipoprotein chaperone LolA [Sulfurimonas lithotrophica]
MKLFLTILFIAVHTYASLSEINTFEADFTQSITDEKNKVLKYNGHITASKPKSATWQYHYPIEKKIYINNFEATIVEPEIEQVIIRRIESEFDFFQLIKKAKKINENSFLTVYNNTEYIIKVQNNLVESISFLDQFENKVKIEFSNQKQNHKIDTSVFTPKYPMDFDIVND